MHVTRARGDRPLYEEGAREIEARKARRAALRRYEPPKRAHKANSSNQRGGNRCIDEATAAAIARIAGATDMHHRNQKGRPP